MQDDERCCGTGTCLINAEGYCWCGQRWNGKVMCAPGTMPALIDRAFDVHSSKVAKSTREQYRIAAEKLKKAFALPTEQYERPPG